MMEITDLDSDTIKTFANVTTRNRGRGYVTRMPFGRGADVEQEIFMVQRPEAGLPALTMARTVELIDSPPGSQLRWSRAHDFGVILEPKSERGFRYRVRSEVISPSPSQLRNSSEDYLSRMTRGAYIRLTSQDLNLRQDTLDLVEDLTEDEDNVYDKLMAIQSWFSRDRFNYTLTIPDLPEENAIDAFIHDTRTGHCELFASAMTLMARSESPPRSKKLS